MAALQMNSIMFSSSPASLASSHKTAQFGCSPRVSMTSRSSSSSSQRLANLKRRTAVTSANWNPFNKASKGETSDSYPIGNLTIFTSKGSRAQIIEWYAMEKGIEFDSVNINMRAGDHKKPPFTNVNPFGKMPAIQAADGTPIFESGAILMYLAGLAGELETPEQYATAAKWILYANATYWTEVEKRRAGPPEQLQALDTLLSDRPYLLGEEFTVSDVAVGSYLYYTKAFFGERFGKYPNVAKYLNGLMEMESFRTTCGAS